MGLFRSYLDYARGKSGSLSPFALLAPFGLLFGVGSRIRNALYDRGIFKSCDPPLPVISVGNISHGGTNKTPAVIEIAAALGRAGIRVGVLSRGYGGRAGGPTLVSSPEHASPASSRDIAGDEPLLMASRLPDAVIAVSPDRLAGVELLKEHGAGAVVADDAFQHRKMARDVDVVLIDASCPFGSGRLFPAGILREPPSALARADIVVITKVDQVSSEELERVIAQVARCVPASRIFTARMAVSGWCELKDGELVDLDGSPDMGRPLLAFSAIASPESFERTLASLGADVARFISFRDHHAFTADDIDALASACDACGASALICTEKDLQNLPRDARVGRPILIPKISFAPTDPDALWAALAEELRPHLVVTSNGHGEDSIGALLASRMRARWPEARVSAFALVGSGAEYRASGVEVLSPPSEKTSGGVVKYSLRALLSDMREGLMRDIGAQIRAWRELAGSIRTPICVGDVYLLLMTLWGQGMTPALIATAKSALTNGHMGAERRIVRGRSRAVWTRDEATAAELRAAGADARFSGSPIMDLAFSEAHCDASEGGDDPWEGLAGRRVMLLPGSRQRAYDDIDLLIGAVEAMARETEIACVMVLAPTIELGRLMADPERARRIEARARVIDRPVASAARGAEVLIGLGGTANQVCAGLGVPVVSVLEKGKLAQKKLLRDSEILVPATEDELARAALDILNDPARAEAMSKEGIKMLGGPGALDAALDYAAGTLGWDARHDLYIVMRDIFLKNRALTE